MNEDAQRSTNRTMKKKVILSAAVMLLIAATAAGSIALASAHSPSVEPHDVAVPLVQSHQPAPSAPAAAMIRSVLPSVVNIRVTQVGFNQFAGPQKARAEGSGVILSPDGVIVTNNHVVAGAVNVRVVFTDGHASMEGTVTGTDPQHDLAVIKVNATGLTPITLGRSGDLELGDPSYAIGFPLGLGPTVTKGIVSGLNRTVQVQGPDGAEHLVGLLQTDAAINPGNSGGALVDASGQLVGVNTAAAQAGAAENVGFAIAVDEAVPVIHQTLSRPPSQQAWLGVEAASVDSPAAAAALGLPPTARGAAVVGVLPGSPAAEGGLRPGDVIDALGGTPIRSDPDLTDALARLHPGQSVQVDVMTGQGSRQVGLVLAGAPPE